jgi:predicted DNA-binding mobile mystery protein A
MRDGIRHLDQRFKALRPLTASPRPPKGWVRAIRDALGMTAKQLALRLGVAQPRITELEKAELSGSITLRSLERAAEALGCRVIYALVPEHSLADLVETQAKRMAHQQLARVEQTMSLENQSVHNLDMRKGLQRQIIDELLRKPARLWDEP